MEQQFCNAMAHAISERRLESRNDARRKVIELAADFAEVLAAADPHFRVPGFYRDCGFTGDDIALAEDRGQVVDTAGLRPDDHRVEGHKNYETFVVCNWLDSTQDYRAEARETAREAARTDPEFGEIRAAEALRKRVEELHLTEDRTEPEDVLTGLASSLLNAGLSGVDWLEVAQTFLSDED